jgi:hypothetical protein
MRLAIIHPFILAYEELDPKNVVSTGVPGSEETLIQFSSELSRQGVRVTVYTHLKERMTTNDGVAWENIKTMRRESFYEVVISWSDLIDKLEPYLKLIPGSQLKCLRLVNQQPEDSLRQVLQFFPIALSQTHWLGSR